MSPPPLPPPRRPEGPYRVCFVCLGNICRSPMAEVVARAQLAEAGLGDAVTVDSAGTGDWHVGAPMNSRARGQLARRGYDGEAHRARQYEASWLACRDLVLAMDHDNLNTLKSVARTDRGACSPPGFGEAEVTGKHGDSSRIRLFGDVAGLDGADVPDPYGGNPVEFARVLDLLESAMPKFIAQLAALCASS
ncbi:MAG: low molecular weight phosphotyrosine protein phosphatase [Nocardiopsaceae bacterium]|nr:low molecular weight phosphotyrosine protein phosphatase [Nocardiopsaceae bacterium]